MLAETRPIYFYRYEDVVTNPVKTLCELFAFILGVPTLEGTCAEARIKEVVGMGKKASLSYNPRQGGSNKNKIHYTDDLLNTIKEKAEEMLHVFGYVADGRYPETYKYFDYEGKHRKESEEKLNCFKFVNQRAMKLRLETKHGDLPEKKFAFGNKNIPDDIKKMDGS